jgi:hypothetical protein
VISKEEEKCRIIKYRRTKVIFGPSKNEKWK